MDVESCEVRLTQDALWSDGEPFSGFLLFMLVPPLIDAEDNYPQVYIGDQFVTCPQRFVFRIKDGKLEKAHVIKTTSLHPHGSRYYPFYLTPFGNVLAVGSGPLNTNACPLEITAPALTTPTPEVGVPELEAGSSLGQVTNVITLTTQATAETPAGSKNGVNKTFTVSRQPNLLMLSYNGQILMQADGSFILVGTTLTLSGSAVAPSASDSFKAILIG